MRCYEGLSDPQPPKLTTAGKQQPIQTCILPKGTPRRTTRFTTKAGLKLGGREGLRTCSLWLLTLWGKMRLSR